MTASPQLPGRGRVGPKVAPGSPWIRAVVALAGLLAVGGTVARLSGEPTGWHLSLVFLATSLSYLVVGALILERRPGNAVGPLVLALGVLLVGYVALDAYIRQPAGTSAAAHAALVVSLTDGPMFFLVALLFLAFPDGHLPSNRWRILVALDGAVAAAVLLGALLRPGRFPFYTWLENPLDPPMTVLTDVWELTYGLTVVGVAAAALSLVGRWRRGGLVERAQLKWVAGAATLAAAAMIGYGVGAGPSDYSDAGDFAVGLSLGLFPVAIGIAVLRYRLYEIDRVISRTLAWALVTAILVGLFALVVIGLQGLLAGATQGDTLAVAASTLLAAALFQPLRARVQRAVDRRFNRSRIDAEQTVAEFSDRLRDEVDLDRLHGAVIATARTAVHPAGAGLWLRREAE